MNLLLKASCKSCISTFFPDLVEGRIDRLVVKLNEKSLTNVF